MNDDISDFISKQALFTQESIDNIVVMANSFLLEMCSQVVDELSSLIQISFQQLISVCHEALKEELPKIQTVTLKQLNEALSKSILIDGDNVYIEENAFNNIIEITDIPVSLKMPPRNDGTQKADFYKIFTIIIAVLTLAHSISSSHASSESWSKLLQIEEERLAIEKEQNAQRDDIIHYLQSCFELLEALPESNQEVQGLHEKTLEIQDRLKEIP